MRYTNKALGRALCAALLAGSLGACKDYISNVPDNSNLIGNASAAQLFTTIEVNTWFWSENQVSRFSAMWLNQMAGTDRQFASYDNYLFGEQDVDAEMGSIFGAGGLLDIRDARAKATADGMPVFEAILRIHEAYLVGMGASIWGDFPYREAVGDPTGPPAHLDPQAQVYADVQALLDGAVTQLGTAPTPAEAGILAARDPNFGGNPGKWLAVAHTLKARFYMHWVEAQGVAATAAMANTACGGNCLTKALANAQVGISSAANNWRAIHTSTSTETNIWYQFVNDRAGYISGGRLLTDSLIARSDPRLTVYYSKGNVTASNPTGYRGSAPGTSSGDPGAGGAKLNVAAGGYAEPGADLPIATCAENYFIIAEVQYRLGNTAAAQAALVSGTTCALQQAGINTTPASAVLPAVMPTGVNLLREIMYQKYVSMFLNIEAWNDYKRTCLPDLWAVKAGTSVANVPVPGRLYYGLTERQTNPNLPAPDDQAAYTSEGVDRNPNDPISCPAMTGHAGA